MTAAAVHVLAGEAAFEWSLGDGSCAFHLNDVDHLRVDVDPFPGYHHDPSLVADLADQVSGIWPAPAGCEVHYWLPDREVVGRAMAFAVREHLEDDQWHAHIVLSGKRTPPHPAVARFLVAHEYGHHAEWFLARARGLEDNDLRLDYAAMRGIDPVRASGGRWHLAVGEIIADDFRLLLAGVEGEHWPHPGIDRPGPREADWWAEALLDWQAFLNYRPLGTCPADPDGLHFEGCRCN